MKRVCLYDFLSQISKGNLFPNLGCGAKGPPSSTFGQRLSHSPLCVLRALHSAGLRAALARVHLSGLTGPSSSWPFRCRMGQSLICIPFQAPSYPSLLGEVSAGSLERFSLLSTPRWSCLRVDPAATFLSHWAGPAQGTAAQGASRWDNILQAGVYQADPACPTARGLSGGEWWPPSLPCCQPSSAPAPGTESSAPGAESPNSSDPVPAPRGQTSPNPGA